MEYIVTASEMKRADQNTTAYFGLPALVLMENAARESARYISRHYPRKRKTLILAGSGNNGGDGMAVGRILSQKGYSVTVFFCALEQKCTPQTQTQLAILRKYGMTVTDHFPQEEYDMIIDAVFGVGLSRPLTDSFARVIEQANAEECVKIACDIPSGIDSDSGRVLGCAFRADVTLTYAFVKRGLVFYPGAEYAGRVRCLDIGITQRSFLDEPPAAFGYNREDLSRLPGRAAHSHKGSFGKTFMLAGSKNMSGACELAAESCYRAGAGMVRVMTVEENRVILQKKVPEALLDTYHTQKGALADAAQAQARMQEGLAWANCVVAGCGLGVTEASAELMTLLLDGIAAVKRSKQRYPKLLLDADALNLSAEHAKLRERLRALAADGCDIVLTPHLLEFARLSGMEAARIQEDLMAAGLAFAARYGVTVVLKDARTVVAYPDGRAYLNRNGNSGMATAGSGDVLSGIIGGLMAQGMNAGEAAALGVYLHGAAGDAAAKEKNEYAMLARDIIGALPKIQDGKEKRSAHKRLRRGDRHD